MLSVINIYEELSFVDDDISKFLKDPKVKRFVELSKKKVIDDLTQEEIQEVNSLFKQKYIQEYIKAVEKVGARNGWIFGSITGGIIGSIATTLGLSGAGIPIFVLALMGAVLGGYSLGVISSKINKVIRRWKAENAITTDKNAGVIVTGTVNVPMIRNV